MRADRLDWQVLPDAPDLKLYEAKLIFIREGPGVAVKTLKALPLEDDSYVAAAEFDQFLRALSDHHASAQLAIDSGELDVAMQRCCEALAFASESPAARLPLIVLLASVLARLDRHTDAVAVCDAGLSLLSSCHSSNPSRPQEQERLLLRRAGCFLALSQPLLAVADYRSATALNPQSTRAAVGLTQAWNALQNSRTASASLTRCSAWSLM